MPENYNQNIIARLEKERQEGIYQRATAAMSQAKTESDYLAAAGLFDSISEHKDSDITAASCRSLAEEARAAKIRLEEEALAKVAEKQRLDHEYNIITDSLRDQVRELEKANEKLGFFQRKEKLAIEKEFSCDSFMNPKPPASRRLRPDTRPPSPPRLPRSLLRHKVHR